MGLNVPQVVTDDLHAKQRKMSEKEREIDKVTLMKIENILTPQQRVQYGKMRGEDIDIKALNDQILDVEFAKSFKVFAKPTNENTGRAPGTPTPSQ